MKHLIIALTLTGCAHAPSYEDTMTRQVAAARTAATLFELALGEAERACADKPATRESPCNALPEAKRALARLEQAIVLADANKGAIADALLALEQLAEVVDAARSVTP